MKMFYISITIRCYFASLSINIFVIFTRYSVRYLSLKLYISSKVQSVWHSLSLRNNLFVLGRRITAIVRSDLLKLPSIYLVDFYDTHVNDIWLFENKYLDP